MSIELGLTNSKMQTMFPQQKTVGDKIEFEISHSRISKNHELEESIFYGNSEDWGPLESETSHCSIP